MADILISDLTNSTAVTNGVSNGSGVFDKLMNTVNLYLADQYNSGRLKGTDYANVLANSIQAVVAQSMQFVLQEKQVEAEIAIKEEQTKTLYVDRVRKDKETVALGLDNILKNINTTTPAVYTPYYD